MQINYPYKNVDFFLLEKRGETKQFIYYKVTWYEKGVMHEHLIDYDKTEPELNKRLKHCDCSFCSMWGIESEKWCIVKKVVASVMVKEGLLDPVMKEWL